MRGVNFFSERALRRELDRDLGVSLAQRHNLIPIGRQCRSCNSQMLLVPNSWRCRRASDGGCGSRYRRDYQQAQNCLRCGLMTERNLGYWECQSLTCPLYVRRRKKERVSIFSGTIFNNSQVSLPDILCIVQKFVSEESAGSVATNLEIGRHSVEAIYSRIRRAMLRENLVDLRRRRRRARVVGGVYQADETCIRSKKTLGYPMARRRRQTMWCFGIIHFPSRWLYLSSVPNRSLLTLHRHIQFVVPPTSRIWTDCWKGYNRLRALGYRHQRVNHSLGFFDARNGVHTNGIENVWSKLKGRQRTRHGFRWSSRALYLAEFTWRWNHKSNPAGLFALILQIF